MNIKHLTDAEFEAEVLKHSGKVIVDFYADWCGPCKMLSPEIEQLAEKYPNVKVVKVDIDKCEDTASEYSVMSIPTVILFENGNPTAQSVGFKPADALANEFSL